MWFDIRKVSCVYCHRILRLAIAREHSCVAKRAAENRSGKKLATYDLLHEIDVRERAFDKKGASYVV